jgi:hypothetical protein
MATNYKILGQSAPAATTNTTVYTVPAATQAVVSAIVIANRSAESRLYRIAAVPSGATLANQHYIAYDVTVAGGDSSTLNIGMTLDAGSSITVYAGANVLSFTVFGSEIS